MERGQIGRLAWLACTVGAVVVAAAAQSAGAESPVNDDLRCNPRSGGTRPSIGVPLSTLERARRDCPLLGAIIEQYAMRDLGEAFPENVETLSSHQLTVAARSAALGDLEALQRQARLARGAGATPAAFNEVLYITAVNAGLPKAIEATRALLNGVPADGPVAGRSGRVACSGDMKQAGLASGGQR